MRGDAVRGGDESCSGATSGIKLLYHEQRMTSTKEPLLTGRVEIRVRYAECDPMGVAHHTVYPVWFEMGRTELCRDTGISYRELETSGVFLAVVRLEVRYDAPARYDEQLQLETSLMRATRVKLEHEYRLMRDGLRLTRATSTLACLDADGRLQALPDPLLERFTGC